MKPRRRHLVIVGSALIHGALLALLLAAGPTTAPPHMEVGAMSASLFDGVALASAHVDAPEAPTPPPPQPVSPAVDPPEAIFPTDVVPRDLDVAPPQYEVTDRPKVDDPVALSVAGSASLGSPCDIPQWLQKAMQADAQVLDALKRIPRPARSVANAIMLWDGAWVATESRTAPGMTAIRQALVAGVRAAPEACRDQAILGPALLTLEDGTGTTVVVVGSGAWQWEDLLREDLPAPTSRLAATRVVEAKP